MDSSVITQFPILQTTHRGKKLTYLDSGASAQKPTVVMDAMDDLMRQRYANVHRGIHWLSQASTVAFESAREKAAAFVNAPSAQEIVFTKGLTEGMNMLAQTFGRQVVEPGQVILLTEMEHHSNQIPWMMLAEEKDASMAYIPVKDNGELDVDALDRLLQHDIALASLVHVSNVLGTINPLQEVIAKLRAKNIPVIVDGAQAAPHIPIDVQALDCDFYAVTGHKIYGPTGTGWVWGRSSQWANMPPYHGGGEMVDQVDYDFFTTKETPAKFEAGTPNIVGTVGLAAALDFVQDIGFEAIQAHENQLTAYAKAQLQSIEGLTILGDPAHKISIFAFLIEGYHPHDIATLLDQEGIAVRVGLHCVEPLHKKWGHAGSIRASMGLYNTREDVDALVKGLRKAMDMLG